jgi:hypothetical protein
MTTTTSSSIMKTTPITIEDNGQVTIHSTGTVWMTRHQLADLFGVFVSAVGANIRSILKSEVLDERRVVRQRTHRDGSVTTLYSIEMITTLAFRLKSRKAEQFRQWIVRQAMSSSSSVVMWQIPRTETMPN